MNGSRWAGVQVGRWAGVQVGRWAGVQVCRCAGVQGEKELIASSAIVYKPMSLTHGQEQILFCGVCSPAPSAESAPPAPPAQEQPTCSHCPPAHLLPSSRTAPPARIAHLPTCPPAPPNLFIGALAHETHAKNGEIEDGSTSYIYTSQCCSMASTPS